LAKAVGVSLRSVQRILELMRPRIVRSPVDICFGTQAEPCSEVTPFGKGSAITNGAIYCAPGPSSTADQWLNFTRT
jgi:hypothetical protein